MNWQTAMNLDLIESQARLAEHDRTVQTLKDLLARAKERGDADMVDLFQRCLEKLGEGYDL